MKNLFRNGNYLLYLLRLIPHLPNFLRLFWRLFRDHRVPLRLKSMVVAVLFYFFLPFDLLPDLLPFIGQFDDIALLLLTGYFFIRWSPREVVAEHVAAIDKDFQTKVQHWRL